MKLRRFIPLVTALLTAGLGLVSVASSPARAQGEDGKERIEKKIYRYEPGQDDERAAGAGYLGVQVQKLTSALRRAKNIPGSAEGALVNNVEDGSPADNAGIKTGDVILEVNHKPTPDPSDLIDVVRTLEPATKVPVTLWREGARKTVTVTVSSRPDQLEFPEPPPMPRMEGPRGDHGGMLRMEILRRHHDDIARQLRDIQDQLSRLREVDIARLERQIRELRAELRERNPDRRDRGQHENRDRDGSEEE